MLNCESSQLLMADALYGSLLDQQEDELQEHLQECEACQSLLTALQQDKGVLESHGIASGNFDDIPERVAMDDLWSNIEPTLDSIDAERYRSQRGFRTTPWLAAGMAMAASVIVFFSVLPAGVEESGPINSVAQTAQNSQTSQISPELLSYLTRVETMLMSVANANENSANVVPVQQTFARDMAMQANYMTNNLDDSFNTGQSRLLKDIEFMLLQIANLDESNMEEGVNLLQQYMEDNSVLLKIRLMEMRNQQQII